MAEDAMKALMFAVLAGGLVVGGCAAGNAAGNAAPVVTTVPGVQAVTATDADNGHTITMARGGMLTVRLNSTYWRFGASGAVLRLVGQPTTSAVPLTASHCVPGQGCGSVTEIFQAVGSGKAVVLASRTSCGEARACAPSQGVYQLTVVVN
jgi:hypothetical protein